jgi:hypothetical protein
MFRFGSLELVPIKLALPFPTDLVGMNCPAANMRAGQGECIQIRLPATE